MQKNEFGWRIDGYLTFDKVISRHNDAQNEKHNYKHEQYQADDFHYFHEFPLPDTESDIIFKACNTDELQLSYAVFVCSTLL